MTGSPQVLTKLNRMQPGRLPLHSQFFAQSMCSGNVIWFCHGFHGCSYGNLRGKSDDESVADIADLLKFSVADGNPGSTIHATPNGNSGVQTFEEQS